MKTVTFIRERRSSGQQFVDYFKVDRAVQDVEGAFRSAVEAYLKTPEAKEDVEYAAGDFNWGDALSCIPDQFLANYGIYPASDLMDESIIVNQDEVLFPELQEMHLAKDE